MQMILRGKRSAMAVINLERGGEQEGDREREGDLRERPDSINCLCKEVGRGGRVRVMKMNHYPLEN